MIFFMTAALAARGHASRVGKPGPSTMRSELRESTAVTLAMKSPVSLPPARRGRTPTQPNLACLDFRARRSHTWAKIHSRMSDTLPKWLPSRPCICGRVPGRHSALELAAKLLQHNAQGQHKRDSITKGKSNPVLGVLSALPLQQQLQHCWHVRQACSAPHPRREPHLWTCG